MIFVRKGFQIKTEMNLCNDAITFGKNRKWIQFLSDCFMPAFKKGWFVSFRYKRVSSERTKTSWSKERQIEYKNLHFWTKISNNTGNFLEKRQSVKGFEPTTWRISNCSYGAIWMLEDGNISETQSLGDVGKFWKRIKSLLKNVFSFQKVFWRTV